MIISTTEWWVSTLKLYRHPAIYVSPRKKTTGSWICKGNPAIFGCWMMMICQDVLLLRPLFSDVSPISLKGLTWGWTRVYWFIMAVQLPNIPNWGRCTIWVQNAKIHPKTLLLGNQLGFQGPYLFWETSNLQWYRRICSKSWQSIGVLDMFYDHRMTDPIRRMPCSIAKKVWIVWYSFGDFLFFKDWVIWRELSEDIATSKMKPEFKNFVDSWNLQEIWNSCWLPKNVWKLMLMLICDLILVCLQ